MVSLPQCHPFLMSLSLVTWLCGDISSYGFQAQQQQQPEEQFDLAHHSIWSSGGRWTRRWRKKRKRPPPIAASSGIQKNDYRMVRHWGVQNYIWDVNNTCGVVLDVEEVPEDYTCPASLDSWSVFLFLMLDVALAPPQFPNPIFTQEIKLQQLDMHCVMCLYLLSRSCAPMVL